MRLVIVFALVFLSTFAYGRAGDSCELMVGKPPAHTLLFKPVHSLSNKMYDYRVIRFFVELSRYPKGSNERPFAFTEGRKYMAFGTQGKWAPSAEKMFEELAKFDAFAERLNLKIPAHTGIVVSSKSGWPAIFPRSPESFFEQGMTWIDMRSDFEFPTYPFSIPIMNHERVHILLKETYGREAFVIRQGQVQEAICDFLPALFHGQPPPQIMPDFSKSRWAEFPKRSGGIYTSLLPNTLWEIFRQVPRDEIPDFFSNFFRGLNEFWKITPVRDFLSEQEKDRDVIFEQRNYSAELMVAVAISLRPDLDFSGIEAQIDQITQRSVAELVAKIKLYQSGDYVPSHPRISRFSNRR